MRLRTQLAIQAHIEALPPRAWSRKDFQELLAEKRDEWKAPQYLTPGRLITFLLDNDFARRIDIKSKDYGIKSRYVTGSIDQAFRNQPRRSSYEFQTGTHTFVFLNGKNTGDAGVVKIIGPSGQPIRCTSLERTLIDCVVRPQYVGGITTLANALPKTIDQISTHKLVSLLAQTKYVYPYHQALGFLLQRAGMSPTKLEPLRRLPKRFKFYLDYGMKRSLYDPEWQMHYPNELK